MTLRIVLICCLWLPFEANAQSRAKITSDRRGQGQTPITVGKHYLQLQLGQEGGMLNAGNYGQQTSANARLAQTQLFLRFGLNAKTEVHLASTLDRFTRTSIVRSFAQNAPPTSLPELYSSDLDLRANNLQIGFRRNLWSETRKHAFDLGLIGSYTHRDQPAHSRYRDGNNLQLGLLASKSISNRISALGNIGSNWSVTNQLPELYYLVNFAFDLGKNFGCFFETKNNILFQGDGGSFTLIDGGFTWLLAPNFQFDIFGGWSQLHQLLPNEGPGLLVFGPALRENYWFITGGISWKIKALPSKKAS